MKSNICGTVGYLRAQPNFTEDRDHIDAILTPIYPL